MEENLTCRICGNSSGNQVYVAREMMYGTREPFEYVACARCGCIQIREVPADLGKYYPPDYLAFGSLRRPGRIKSYFRGVWARHALVHRTPVGALLTRIYGEANFFGWVRRAGVGFHDPVLDVGCGRGRLLVEMRSCGFDNMTGIDPFINDSEQLREPGLQILKQSLSDTQGRYSLVMAHHSFEHAPDPREFLAHMRRLVAPGGMALVRIPVAGWGWRHYGVDWMGLDPPRHIYVHSVQSMTMLAENAGFTLEHLEYDSSGQSLWASEQYRRNIPLLDPRSQWVNPRRSVFSREEMEAFFRQAADMDARGDGDEAAFYLRPR